MYHDHERLREVFWQVIEAAAGERGPLADALCGEDQPLRRAIQTLLINHAAAETEGFLEPMCSLRSGAASGLSFN